MYATSKSDIYTYGTILAMMHTNLLVAVATKFPKEGILRVDMSFGKSVSQRCQFTTVITRWMDAKMSGRPTIVEALEQLRNLFGPT